MNIREDGVKGGSALPSNSQYIVPGFKLEGQEMYVYDLNSNQFVKIAVCTLYTQYGPIKNGRIKNQGSDFEKK